MCAYKLPEARERALNISHRGLRLHGLPFAGGKMQAFRSKQNKTRGISRCFRWIIRNVFSLIGTESVKELAAGKPQECLLTG
jgi:hypothetical protein